MSWCIDFSHESHLITKISCNDSLKIAFEMPRMKLPHDQHYIPPLICVARINVKINYVLSGIASSPQKNLKPH